MTLPYKKNGRTRGRKPAAKTSIGGSRVHVPDIYVATPGHLGWNKDYAKAHIRVRRGCYRFLAWREGEKVREFYLGKVREFSPTPGSSSIAGAGGRTRSAGSSTRRVQK